MSGSTADADFTFPPRNSLGLQRIMVWCLHVLVLASQQTHLGVRKESQQLRVLQEVEAPLVNRKLTLHSLSPGERLFQPADG